MATNHTWRARPDERLQDQAMPKSDISDTITSQGMLTIALILDRPDKPLPLAPQWVSRSTDHSGPDASIAPSTITGKTWDISILDGRGMILVRHGLAPRKQVCAEERQVAPPTWRSVHYTHVECVFLHL
jgi:hypothetical protein